MNRVHPGHKLLLVPACGDVTTCCYFPAQKGCFEVAFRDEARSTCSPKSQCPSSCLRAPNGRRDAPARTAFILRVLLDKPSSDTAHGSGHGWAEEESCLPHAWSDRICERQEKRLLQECIWYLLQAEQSLWVLCRAHMQLGTSRSSPGLRHLTTHHGAHPSPCPEPVIPSAAFVIDGLGMGLCLVLPPSPCSCIPAAPPS